MTDQLRDVLAHVADRAGPVTVDPQLWAKASRRRRRRQGATAAAAVVVVVALLSGIAVTTGVLRADPPPVDRPDHDLIEVEGIAGDGGLRVEKDLAVGRASVAIMNDTGAFVVTVDDGLAHRLALPGFDGYRHDLPEVLSLSPDGTKLIYAWHGPLVEIDADGSARPRQGWIESGARLLDLTTGAIDTYPSPTPEPENPGLITQLGRSNWNFRWSSDSRLVAFDEAGGTPGSPSEDWDGQVLDTTKKVTWTRLGPQLNPRRVPGMAGHIEAPVVNDTGLVAWVSTPDRDGRLEYQEQSLMTGTNGAPRQQPLPDGAVWGSGRFSPDGQTLLVEAAGLSDRMLAVAPGRGGDARSLLLQGDLPSKRVRTELLAWVGDGQVLAAVHRATADRGWRAEASLALLTLDLDAGTADVEVVGRVDAAGTASAFSFATDVLAGELRRKGN